MKTKVLLTLPILLLGFFMASSAVTALTDPADSTKSAYFWGGTTDGNVAPVPHAYQGAGAFDASGVNVPSGNEDVTGYAWSGAWNGNGYGWLSFEDADVAGCPSGACESKRQGNAIVGWARILAIKNAEASGNSGGWSGWVQLDPSNGSGVTIDPSGNLSGYAWSNELGYIQFAGAVGSAPSTSLTIRYNNCSNPNSIPADVTFLVTEPNKNIVACETVGTVTTDVTALAAWSEESTNPGVDLSNGGSPRVLDILAETPSGNPETISASYGAHPVASTNITVSSVPSAVCGNGTRQGTEECDEGTDNGSCPKTCSTSCTINNCNPGGFREVAP